MKSLYQIEIDQPSLETSKASKLDAAKFYKKLKEIRFAMGQYISMAKKNGLKVSTSDARAAVANVKYLYALSLDNTAPHYSIVRMYEGNRFAFNFNPHNYKTRKEAVSYIRERIRNRRLQRKTREDFLLEKGKGYYLLQFQKKVLGSNKRPKDNADYIGVEIECIMPRDYSLDALLPYSKWLNITGDGSIQYGEKEEGVEFRVCMKRDEIRTVLPNIVNAINSLGAKVNRSCGFHVHLDQRNNLTPEFAYAKLVRSLGLLFQVVPASRRSNNYCHKNRGVDWNAAVDGGRYKAINGSAYHRHKTIEIRLFGGTLDANKMMNWIEVLLAISTGEMVNRCPKNFDTARQYWKFSDENLAWLKARQAKFSTLNALAPIAESEAEENPVPLPDTACDPASRGFTIVDVRNAANLLRREGFTTEYIASQLEEVA